MSFSLSSGWSFWMSATVLAPGTSAARATTHSDHGKAGSKRMDLTRPDGMEERRVTPCRQSADGMSST